MNLAGFLKAQLVGGTVDVATNDHPPTPDEIKDVEQAGDRSDQWHWIYSYFKEARTKYTGQFLSTKASRIYNANLVDQMCFCRDSFNNYNGKNCAELKNMPQGKNETKKCAKFYRRLNDKKPESVCPLIPSSLGRCGIPKNLDLYGKSKVNVIELNIGKYVNADLGSKKIDIKKDCYVKPRPIFQRGMPWNVRRWIWTALRQGVEIDTQKGTPLLRWTGKIPKNAGLYFTKNCNSDFFTVRFKLKCDRKEISVGGLDFSGMGYTIVPPKGRRRRLLQHHQGRC